jgi:hypothetical protein
MGLLDRAKATARSMAQKGLFAPLISTEEKSELEALLETRLMAFYTEHGGRKLLEAGWDIALSAQRGVQILRDAPTDDELARIRVGDLLSIRGLLASDSPQVIVTRNMVPILATEATRALSQRLNEFAEHAARNAEPNS